MGDLTAGVIQQNTDLFYYLKEKEAEEQNNIYKILFEKSMSAIKQNIKMFDSQKISYELVNSKGKAILTTEVLFFKEEENPKLILQLIGDYKEEQGKDKFYSFYNINAGENSVFHQTPFTDETELAIEYSNTILGILEKRPLGEFLNNFDTLYAKK